MNENEVAMICKALSDTHRLKIIKILTQGQKCACDLLEEFHITQPTLSHHMKVLAECNLIFMRKEGKWTYYTINCEQVKNFKNFIGGLECVNDGKDCNCRGDCKK